MRQRAFTLVELLIAVAVILVVAAMSIAVFSNYRKSALLAEAKNKTLAEINLARSKTLGSEENSNYGIHFEENRIVLFKGSTYSSLDPDNKETPIPPGIRISLISLVPATSDVVFERLTGKAVSSGTITLEVIGDLPRSATIIIYSSGALE